MKRKTLAFSVALLATVGAVSTMASARGGG